LATLGSFYRLTGVQLQRDIRAVEAHTFWEFVKRRSLFNICSWDSMNVSAGPPALSLSTSVGRQNRACILQLHCPSVCDWPVYKQSDPWRLRCGHPTSYVSYTLSAMDCSRGVGCGINETEAQCAITNCTLRASGTVPATGMSNPQ